MKKKVFLVALVLLAVFLTIFKVYSQETGCCAEPAAFTCNVVPSTVCPEQYFYEGQDCSAVTECQYNPTGCCIDACTDANYQAQCSDRTKFRVGPCTQQPECQRGCCVCDKDPINATDNLCFPLLTAAECNQECLNFIGYYFALHEPDIQESAECQNLCPTVGVIPASVSGYVRDIGGNPIPQAVVQAATKTTLTNSLGFYSLSDIPTGRITISASKAGYTTEQKAINLSSGQAATQDFTLSISALGTIKGKITDEQGNPIQDAIVSLSGTSLASTTTNVNGEYEIILLPLGIYNIRAHKISYIDSNTSTLLTAAQNVREINLQLTSVPKATLKGVITDSVGEPVPFAKIYINGKVEAFSQTATGRYSIDLPAEPTGTDYSIYVTRAGFSPSDVVDITLVQFEVRELDFTLATVLCAYPETRPVPEITADHIPGVEAVQLRWKIPGACTNLAGYIITKQHFIGDELQSEEDFAFLKVTEIIHPVDYIDNDVSWSETYQYKISAVYTDQQFRNSTPTLSNKITLGNETCEDKYRKDFERFIEFCMGNYNRMTCNYENQLIPAPRTSVSLPDCSDISPQHFCSGPDFLGYTICRNVGACNPVLQGATPFGFYFDEASCLGKNNENYCYYDYSITIVDVCLPCSHELTCFDYKSKTACLADNCVVSNTSRCQWVDTFYAGLGKGLCYQENYTGTNYCYKCSETYSLFQNYGCNQNVCSKLGKCYADETNSNCLGCEGTTKCNDFETREQCEGNQPLQIFGCNQKITPSNDSCSLGTCRWNDAAEICFKDANNDDIPDCDYLPSIYRDECKEDNKAPNTRTEKQFYLAGRETMIVFFSDEDADSLHYCVDHDNACCPTENLYFTNGEAILNPATAPGFEELYERYGTVTPYYVRFYATDRSSNQEELKSISFYIDMAPPKITLDYEIIPSGTGNFSATSDLKIEATLDEVATCSDSLIYVATGTEQTTIQSETGDFFALNYSGLPDGVYIYEINCVDSFGNRITEKIEPLVIDAFRYIDVISPLGATKSTSITFQIKTQDQSVCDLYRRGEFFDEFDSTDFLTHTTSTHIFETNTHYPYFEARCIDLTDAAKKDSATIIFTIDQLAPVTSVNISNSRDYYFSTTEWKAGLKGDVSLILSCNDPLPSSFGCDLTDIRYCIADSLEESCTPDSTATRINIVNDTRICYFSTDKGGNTELVKCGDILIGKFFGILMIRPPYNVSNTPTFDVEIETDRETESCKFAAGDFIYSELVSPLNQFVKLSSTRFIYYNFSFSLPYPMNIKCRDTEGKVNEEPAVFLLEYDPTPPVITQAYADPAPVIQGSFTTLNVITDDKTICKFDKAAQLYQYMEGRFEGWNEKEFSTTHKHRVTVTAADDQTMKNFTVACENRAGNISSTKKIEFEVDFSTAGSIIGTFPDKATKESTVNLTVLTNKNAICQYQDDAIWRDFETTGVTEHISTKEGLKEGYYTYPVKCRFIQSNDVRDGAIKFNVDQTPPVMTEVEDYEFACGTTAQPTFEANDISPIAYYNFSIYESGTNDLILPWTTSTSNNPKLEGLDIFYGRQYYFRVKAVDEAGNEGSELQSDGFTVRNITEEVCREDEEPPTVTLSTAIVSEGVEVTLECYDKNGCSEKLYSTSIPPDECFIGDLEYTSSVILEQTSNFCYEVTDGVGNTARGSQLIITEDEDLDGVPNDKDQCPGTPTGATVDENGCSSEQKDTDGDGMPDYWELRYDLNPDDPSDRDEDPDNDGFTNYEEYVQGTDPTIPDVYDADNDGIPDAQDLCPYTPAGEFVDSQGCSDSQKDSDGDGIDDDWENRGGLDPLDPTDANIDSDGDGLTNLEEYNYYKNTGRYIDPNNKDTDGDGWTDKEEIDQGFNPADPNSHPERRLFSLILLIFGFILVAAGSGYLIYTKYVTKKPPVKPYAKPPVTPYAPPTAAPGRPAAPALPRPAVPARPAPPLKPVISPAELRRRANLERLRKARERKSKQREKFFEAFGPERVTVPKKPEEKPKPKEEKLTPKEKHLAKDIFDHLGKITTKEEKKRILSKLSKSTEKSIKSEGKKETFEKLSKLTKTKLKKPKKKAKKPTKEVFEKLSQIKKKKK